MPQVESQAGNCPLRQVRRIQEVQEERVQAQEKDDGILIGMRTLSFYISGQIHGGKNHIGITKTGKRYPKKEFVEFRNHALKDLAPYLQGEPPFEGPIRVYVGYCKSDRRRRDLPALIDGLWHVFERAAIVNDDSQFEELVWVRTLWDEPGVRITFEEIEPIPPAKANQKAGRKRSSPRSRTSRR